MLTKAEREALLSSWIKPSSTAEKDRQARAERMVRDAVAAWPAFDGHRASIRVYTKGSYPNETNVRIDSDVDVVVQYEGCVFYDHGHGVTPPPAGSVSAYTGPWKPATWRRSVRDAMTNCFGASGIDATGKIAIRVEEVPGSRPSADVVPSFEFHRYWDTAHSRWTEGSCVFDTSGNRIVNWPAQQLANGRAKNQRTGGRYKRFVRALKNAENVLAQNGIIEELPSYFMECLVYNVGDSTLVSGELEGGFRETLLALYRGLDNASEWLEPNERKYLFRGGQKWNADQGKKLVAATWSFLDYS